MVTPRVTGCADLESVRLLDALDAVLMKGSIGLYFLLMHCKFKVTWRAGFGKEATPESQGQRPARNNIYGVAIFNVHGRPSSFHQGMPGAKRAAPTLIQLV